MKKVKVIIKEWECKEVEYICKVDDAYYEDDKDGNWVKIERPKDAEEWDAFGIGYLDGGDLGTDAEGFDAITISKRIIDKDADSNWDVVEWHEIEEGEDKRNVGIVNRSLFGAAIILMKIVEGKVKE